jgi:hypothetical protein
MKVREREKLNQRVVQQTLLLGIISRHIREQIHINMKAM